MTSNLIIRTKTVSMICAKNMQINQMNVPNVHEELSDLFIHVCFYCVWALS